MTELQQAWADGGYARGLLIPDTRHPGTQHFARLFATGHLSEHAAATAHPFAAVAQHAIDTLKDSPELSACLRKLLEAKDCAVRARLFTGD